jgi:hypothetical protein
MRTRAIIVFALLVVTATFSSNAQTQQQPKTDEQIAVDSVPSVSRILLAKCVENARK